MNWISIPKRPVLLVFLLSLALLAPPSVKAGQMVLASCWDNTGSQMGQRVHKLLKKELLAQGGSLYSYRSYLESAQKKGLDRKALVPSSIKTLASSMDLYAVVTCKVKKKGSRFSIEFKLYGASGKKLLSQTRSNKKPWLRLGTVQALAKKLIEFSGNAPQVEEQESEELALVPLVPLVPKKDETAKEETKKQKPVAKESRQAKAASIEIKPKETVQKTTSKKISKHAFNDKLDAEKKIPITPSSARSSSVEKRKESPGSLAINEGRNETRPTRASLPAGPLSSFRLVVGESTHSRAGLSPRYDASFYPGLRLDANIFLGAFLDTPVLADMGIGGKFDRAFGLRYSLEKRPEKLAASEQHWSVQFMYRLEIEKLLRRKVFAAPTLMAKFGYGNLESYIDKKFPDVLSVRYTYTYGALDFSFWLLRSLLSMHLSAAYLFDTWPSGSLSGDGNGFSLKARVDLRLLDSLLIEAGYEQVQFLLDDKSLGKISDRYQVLSICFGWYYD